MKLFFYCKSLFKKLRERRERQEGRERKEGEGGKVMEDEAERGVRGNDVILGGYDLRSKCTSCRHTFPTGYCLPCYELAK